VACMGSPRVDASVRRRSSDLKETSEKKVDEGSKGSGPKIVKGVRELLRCGGRNSRRWEERGSPNRTSDRTGEREKKNNKQRY